MAVLLGIDLGTTGLKAMIADTDGEVIASAYRTLPLRATKVGYAEQDPETWWVACQSVVRELGEKDSASLSRVAGVGISGQMHGLVLLRKDGLPLRPALTWTDQRGDEQCHSINENVGAQPIRAATGNPIVSAFTLPKLMWVQQHEPDVFAHARTLLLPKDYLRFRLTGSLHTDESDASGTLMFDIHKKRWSREIADALGYSLDILPEVKQSTHIVGHLKGEVARHLGLPSGIPVVTGGADLGCTCLAMGLVAPGTLGLTIGTAGQVLAALDDPKVVDDRLYTFCHVGPSQYFALGSVFAGGLSLRWLRDTIGCQETPYDTLVDLAVTSSVGSRGLLFVPHLTGSSTPHHDAKDRAAFVGLTLSHGKAEMIRAVLEGVTFSMKEVLSVYAQSGLLGSQIRIAGGAARNSFWQALQADIYGRPVVPLRVRDASLIGALMVTGVGIGSYNCFGEAISKFVHLDDPIEPTPANSTAYQQYYRIYQRLREDLHPANTRLSSMV